VLNETDNHYQLMAMFSGEDIASPNLFPDLEIDLREVFSD
jgi:Uma2 family endonuclease